MSKLQIVLSVLILALMFMPSVLALEGESPVAIFDRLSAAGMLVIYAASAFFFILGAGMVIVGGASASTRTWGMYIIICVLGGNALLVVVPWILDIIKGVQ